MKWTDEDASVASIAAHKLLMSRKFKKAWKKGPAKNIFLKRLDTEVAKNEIKNLSLQKSTQLLNALKNILIAEKKFFF